MAKPQKLEPQPWPKGMNFPNRTTNIQLECDWSKFTNTSKEVQMARGVASVSDSPLMSARHGLNMLLALYESEPETVTIAEDAPTLPFLFRSSSCGDKASMWDGVGTNNILVALRYACLSVATAYYTAAMKVKTHKELLTNLKTFCQIPVHGVQVCSESPGCDRNTL